MEDIKTKLAKLFQISGNLSKNTLDEFFSLLTIKTIGKGIDIVIKGNRDTKEYFLLDGILREYTYNENADEVTLNFYVEESFILPNFCRTNEDISLLSMQALSFTTIAEIEASEHERYRNCNREFSNTSAIIIAQLFKIKLQRQIAIASLPGIEKLAQFRKDFPGLENRVTHLYIASYLGITNVSLSRLRSSK